MVITFHSEVQFKQTLQVFFDLKSLYASTNHKEMIKGKVITILIDRTINGCTSLVQDLSMELRLQRMFLKAQIKYNRLIIQYIKPVTCSSYTFGVFVDEYWKLAIVSFNFLLKSYFVCTFLEKKK